MRVLNAPVRPSDSIGDLCVALAHRWEPERLFVIFTAYFDEADTHTATPTIIMAAFLAHAYQWRRFEIRLARIQEKFGFKIFHAKDFKVPKGEFAGWGEAKAQALIWELTELVRDTLTDGMVVALEHARYASEYRAPPIPKKMSLDSQYGVCFRSCLSHLLDRMKERGYRDKLNIVMESGHKNVWDCGRIFDGLKKRFDQGGLPVLGTFTVQGKNDSPPLMVADFLAAFYSMLRAQYPGQSPDAYADRAPEPGSGEAQLTFLELLPDALRNLKLNFERLRQMEIDNWRAKRAARLAALQEGALP